MMRKDYENFKNNLIQIMEINFLLKKLKIKPFENINLLNFIDILIPN